MHDDKTVYELSMIRDCLNELDTILKQDKPIVGITHGHMVEFTHVAIKKCFFYSGTVGRPSALAQTFLSCL